MNLENIEFLFCICVPWHLPVVFFNDDVNRTPDSCIWVPSSQLMMLFGDVRKYGLDGGSPLLGQALTHTTPNSLSLCFSLCHAHGCV